MVVSKHTVDQHLQFCGCGCASSSFTQAIYREEKKERCSSGKGSFDHSISTSEQRRLETVNHELYSRKSRTFSLFVSCGVVST